MFIREVQNSLQDSVKQLVMDKIRQHGLGDYFEEVEREIRCTVTGSRAIFRGMNEYNADNIKSLEAFDFAWWEEAANAKARSFRLLRPTMRKPGSELWFSWNPRHDDDPVDAYFRGETQPPNAIVVECGWWNNPWLSEEILAEKDHDYATDAEMAEHVWGGGYEIITERSYYARQIKELEDAGRVGVFPYQPHLPVDTAWDIGVDDYTAIWFLQTDGKSVWVIDFYETQNMGAPEIIKTALPEYARGREKFEGLIGLGRKPAYTYGTHWLPHDIAVREWGGGAKERTQVLIENGIPQAQIRKGVQTDPADRVQAVRSLLPVVHFNETPRVRAGLTRLRRYSRRWNEALGTYTGPLKDGNDHAADAFGEYAINNAVRYEEPPAPKPEPTPEELGRIRLTWPEARAPSSW